MAQTIHLLTKDFSIVWDEDTKKLNVENKEVTNDPKNVEHPFTDAEKIEYLNKLKRSFYKKKLEKQFENLIIFSGSGTSVGVGIAGKKGKTMVELWEKVDINEEIELRQFCEKIDYDYEANKNLERLLSYAKRAVEFNDKFVDVDVESKIKQIELLIKNECTLTLPENSPHEILLNKLAKRKLKYPRVKIFTLNYDTLFEQAANENGIVLIDGFSYSFPRTFNGKFFKVDFVLRESSRINSEGNYLNKVGHLYKLHGSINWSKNNNKVIIEENTENPLLIYPNDSKYEHSYEQPFFEMMARLQSELRKENVLLICIGFSFGDKHITTVLKEAVSQNPSFELMVINKNISDDKEWKWLKDKAELDSRICLVNEDFTNFSKNFPEIDTITKEEILNELYEED